MEKYIIAGLTLLSGAAMADYFVVIADKQFKISEPIETIQCEGAQLTRAELDIKIANDEDVTKVCTGQITDFSKMFSTKPTFNQDISNWDVSNGTNFYFMFYGSQKFNQDLSSWNVSKGVNFGAMFYIAYAFNQDLSSWDVSNGTHFNNMFAHSIFNYNISHWDVENATQWGQFRYNGSLDESNTPIKFL